MTVMLDRAVQVGDATVAAICRVRVVPQGWRGGALFLAEKMPVAILIGHAGRVACFAPDATGMSREEIEALCPGALAAFSAPGP